MPIIGRDKNFKSQVPEDAPRSTGYAPTPAPSPFVQPQFKRIGSPEESIVQSEHAALVEKLIADRQRQAEKDARSHAESAASRPVNLDADSNRNIYVNTPRLKAGA